MKYQELLNPLVETSGFKMLDVSKALSLNPNNEVAQQHLKKLLGQDSR